MFSVQNKNPTLAFECFFSLDDVSVEDWLSSSWQVFLYPIARVVAGHTVWDSIEHEDTVKAVVEKVGPEET